MPEFAHGLCYVQESPFSLDRPVRLPSSDWRLPHDTALPVLLLLLLLPARADTDLPAPSNFCRRVE